MSDPKSDSKWLGNCNLSDENTCRLAHFEARELSYPIMTFPGPFWNLENQGSPIEKKSQNPCPGSPKSMPRFPQVEWVGFGLIWDEILTKWLENGPYELIFSAFAIESWLRVRFWGSRRSGIACFGGFAKKSKDRPEFCVTIESGPWGHFNHPILAGDRMPGGSHHLSGE